MKPLRKKIGTLNQMKINELRSEEERRKPCDPVPNTC